MCIEVGMNDFLSKPVDFEEFEKTLATVTPLQRMPGEQSVASDLAEANENVADLKTQFAQARSEPGTGTGFDPELKKYPYSMEQRIALVQAFLKESEQRRKEIRHAQDSHDVELLVRASHSIKSAAAFFSAGSVVDSAQAVEQLSRGNKFEEACMHLDVLLENLERLQQDMQKWLESLSDWKLSNESQPQKPTSPERPER